MKNRILVREAVKAHNEDDKRCTEKIIVSEELINNFKNGTTEEIKVRFFLAGSDPDDGILTFSALNESLDEAMDECYEMIIRELLVMGIDRYREILMQYKRERQASV